jgi:hypothetical protein
VGALKVFRAPLEITVSINFQNWSMGMMVILTLSALVRVQC